MYSKMIKDIVIAVSLILCLFQVEARPDGATVLACDTLIPDHGINQVGSDPFPYKVDISNFVVPQYRFGYKGGRKYFVWLSGTSLDRDFRGFLIQARTVGDNSSVGTFSRSFSNKQVCIGDSAATHVSRRQKDFVTLYWTAPPAGTGPIRFWYSFVDVNRKGRVRHWGGEASEVIREVPQCDIEGQVYTTCGTACPPTCGYQPYGCVQKCVTGCQCPYGTVLDETINSCVRREDCACQVQGQIKSDCASEPRCATTCNNRHMPRPCPANCVVNGCECPNGTVIDEVTKRCVLPSECPEVPSCPIKGQFYTTDCHLTNATCTDPYPVAKCNHPRCVCPRGQVVDEVTNACINANECPDVCKINNITGRVRYNKRKSKLRLKFSSGYEANGAIFECKLDDEEYTPCTSPKVWRKLNLSTERHVATVKAKCIYNDDVMSTKSKGFQFQIDK